MGIKTDNIAGLFKNTRTRVIIIFTLATLVLAFLVGLWSFRRVTQSTDTQVALRVAPAGIQSVPGGLNPTEEYVKLQKQQNREQAEAAQKSGKSALPTILRTKLFEKGQELDQQGGLGFSSLARTQKNAGQQKPLWIDELKKNNCDPATVKQLRSEGVPLGIFREAGCNTKQLLAAGFTLEELRQAGFTANELRLAGFSAKQLRDAGYSAADLRDAGFSACETKAAGYSAKELREGGYSDGELRGAGFETKIGEAGLPPGFTTKQIRESGCSVAAIKREREAGISAAAIMKIKGCSAAALKSAGYTAEQLKEAGFSAEELKKAGFSARQLLAAGYSAKQLKQAGFSPAALRLAGLTAQQLRDAGFSAEELKNAGFTAKDLKDAGFSEADLRKAGYDEAQLAAAGVTSKKTEARPGSGKSTLLQDTEKSVDSELERIAQQQRQQMSRQRTSQELRQIEAKMRGKVTQLVSQWDKSPNQVYSAGEELKTDDQNRSSVSVLGSLNGSSGNSAADAFAQQALLGGIAPIKAGDIMFAVLDTAVNSDEPGPVLAHIVSGPYKGAKIIGALTRPENGQKLTLTFSTLSVPDLQKTIPINAVAIDQNTARIGLSSKTDNHYLLRYGALFSSSFLEGFGSSIQTSGTSITESPTGDRTFNQQEKSLAESGLAALGTVGQRWGNAIAPTFNRPPTIEVYSGTALGILFTQDITTQQQLPTVPQK